MRLFLSHPPRLRGRVPSNARRRGSSAHQPRRVPCFDPRSGQSRNGYRQINCFVDADQHCCQSCTIDAMNLGRYVVTGVDTATGSEASLTLQSDSVPSALAQAREKGLSANTVESPKGVVYRVHEDGKISEYGDRETSGSSESDPDLPLKIISLFIPLVGFIAGAIRLGNRDGSGGKIVAWAVIGFILWVFLVMITL